MSLHKEVKSTTNFMVSVGHFRRQNTYIVFVNDITSISIEAY